MSGTSPTSPQRAGTHYATLPGNHSSEPPVSQPGDPGFFFPEWLLGERRAIPFVCMIWWALSIFVTLIHYLTYMRKSEAGRYYGEDLQRAYLAFVVIGMIVYFTVAATCWYWAGKYSVSRVDRKRKTILGIITLFFFNDMPLWAMDYKAVGTRGVPSASALTASFVFNTITFLVGAIVVWLTYAHKVSTYFNDMYGSQVHRPVTSAFHSGSVFPERGGGVPHTTPPGLSVSPERPIFGAAGGEPSAVLTTQPYTPSPAQQSFAPPPHLQKPDWDI